MALILSIETATTVCSVAIHKDGHLLANQSVYLNQSHSSRLVPIIDAVMVNTGYHLNDLEAVVISKGPGSYTGLRIGTSTAKGLCYALDIPLIAVNTLKAMALQVNDFFSQEHLLLPMIDARRMEVYGAIFNTEMQTLKETKPIIIEETSFKDIIEDRPLVLFGNGAEKCKGVLNNPNIYFVDNISPDASTVGDLGFLRFQKEQFENLAYFEPFYLKEFMATKPKNIL